MTYHYDTGDALDRERGMVSAGDRLKIRQLLVSVAGIPRIEAGIFLGN
ncbi:MAG: hypothetical protein AAGA60_26985 [Cyanobacteria bacterium P01_E01_bin.42]